MSIISKTVLPLFRSINRKLFGVSWKDLRQLHPVSEIFGKDRGLSIDRYYIEKFLHENRHLINGTVVEVADNHYTKKFGKDVTKSEVLHFAEDNPIATMVGDLSKTDTLKHNHANCFICTQTLNFLYDFKSAVEGLHYMLTNKGNALVTLGGISQISRYDMDRWGDYWRFTTKSAMIIFSEVFGEDNVKVDSYGNVLASTAFLHGISAEELSDKELLYKDYNYQQVITIVARKVTT